MTTPNFSRIQLRRGYANQRAGALASGMLAADFDLLAQAHESVADILNNCDRGTLQFDTTRSPLKVEDTHPDLKVDATAELQVVERGAPAILYRLYWVGNHQKALDVMAEVEEQLGKSLPYWEGDDQYSILETVMEIARTEFHGKIGVPDSLVIFERMLKLMSKKELHVGHDPEKQQFHISYARGAYFVHWIYTYCGLMQLNRVVRERAAEE